MMGDRIDSNSVDLLFDPRFGVMRAVVFASGSGTNFREAILESRVEGSNSSVDLLLTDKFWKVRRESKTIGAISYAMQYGIPLDTVNGFEMCGSFKEAQKTLEGRLGYDQRAQAFNKELLGKVQRYEHDQRLTFDLAILAGYMRLFKNPLLRRFNRRAITVHPADLSVLDADGSRKYVGEDAVYDALRAGEKRTRSSIIMLDPDTDAGAILVSGPWVEYLGGTPESDDELRLEADMHQDRQKKASDWPALRFALRSIAKGELGLHKRKFHPDGNPVVVYQGKEMPYEGYVLERAA